MRAKRLVRDARPATLRKGTYGRNGHNLSCVEQSPGSHPAIRIIEIDVAAHVKDPANVARIMEEAKTRGGQAGLGGEEAKKVRGLEVEQTGQKEQVTLEKKSDFYYKTPLSQLPNGEGFTIAKNQHIANPNMSLEQWAKPVDQGGMGGKFAPEELLQEYRNTQQVITMVSHLRDLYLATKPAQRGAVVENIRGHLRSIGAPLGMAEEVRDYTEAKNAFASRLQAVSPEAGIRVSPQPLKGYMDYLPGTNRIESAGTAKFDTVIRMLKDGYDIMLNIYKRQGTELPELKIPSSSPDVDADLERYRRGGK